MTSKIMMLRLADIDTRQGTQTRHCLNQAVIEDYAEKIRTSRVEGTKNPLPPCGVVRDATGKLILAAGFHRFSAHQLAGETEIECEVTQGDLDAAKIIALDSNNAHGLQPNDADKRQQVLVAFTLPGAERMSNVQLAKIAHVSESLVRGMRTNAPTERTIIRNGKEVTMNTANIGTPKPPEEYPAKPTIPVVESQHDNDLLDKAMLRLEMALGDSASMVIDAIESRTLPLSEREIMDWADGSEGRIKAIEYYVVSLQMSPVKAYKFLDDIPETLEHLQHRALANKGSFTLQHNGFLFTCQRV